MNELPSDWRICLVEWIDVEQSWSVGAARYIGKSKTRGNGWRIVYGARYRSSLKYNAD